MSDTSQGEGWWLASDGKWYPPTASPAPTVPVPPPYVPAGLPTANEAIWSLILGIGSFFLCGIFMGIPAIILGNNAKKKIATAGGQLGGQGLATAGIVLGWIQVGLTIVAVLLLLLILALGGFAASNG
jgi:hypothetical protein